VSIRGLLGVHNSLIFTFLSNIESFFVSIPGLLGIHNVLCFICFTQHWVIVRVHPRFAGSAEFVDFFRFWRTLSNLLCPSEVWWEWIIYWFLKVLSNIESSFVSIRGLLGVYNLLFLQVLSNIEGCIMWCHK
jgi:UPF0716 family protein affecting phage T7 exclusion